MNRKSELEFILKKLKKTSSLTEIFKLKSETVKILTESQQEGQLSKEEVLIISKMSGEGNFKTFDFIKRWNDNKVQPNNEEIKCLERLYAEIPQVIEMMEKALEYAEKSGENKDADLRQVNELNKEIIKKIKECQKLLPELFQRERNRQRQQEEQIIDDDNQGSSIQSDFSSRSGGDTSQLSQEIKNLQNQISNLQTQQQAQPLIDNSQELKKTEQLLRSLQNDLQNIERRQNSVNSSTSQQEKQELAKLKKQLIELQNQLKQSQISQPKQQNNSQPEKEFNWLYVVIPAGVIIAIMGMVITYLIGKNKKRE